MRWMIKTLDQAQELALQDILLYRNSAWIDGFAGSGKSIVAAHLCKRIRTRNPSAKIAFITYTHALKDMLRVGLDALSADGVIVTTHTELKRSGTYYDIIVLDEVQDIPRNDIISIKKLCERLVVAGDVDQSIYPNGISADELMQLLQPKKHRLSKIFRLTEKARRIALAVLPNARVASGENASNRAEADFNRIEFSDEKNEALWVYEDASSRARAGYPSALLLTTHKEIYRFAELVAEGLRLPSPPRRKGLPQTYEDFNAFWKEEGHPLRFLGGGSGRLIESDSEPIVYLMTYHSSKGLDFQNVYLPRALPGMNLDPSGAGGEEMERRLMFVAVTRTRENLFVSHTGPRAHRFIEELPFADVVRITNPKRRPQHLEDADDIF
jgi:superfamily I DNA/RNA helicase